MARDYYATLALTKSASDEQIKAACVCLFPADACSPFLCLCFAARVLSASCSKGVRHMGSKCLR